MIARYKSIISILFCVTLLTSQVCASVLKDALEEHLKDVAHNEGAESVKHDKQKGEKIHEIESQVNDSHKNQYSKANDEANYLKKDHESKIKTENDAYQGHNSEQDKSEDSQATGFKRGHKKGHHKQGFQNSYHKDESSNKSSFFDDFNDEGDQAAYNSRLNSHDNQGGRRYQGSHNNGQEYVRDNYQGGRYNRYGDNGHKHLGHQDHGKKYFLDDQANYNKYTNGRNVYDKDKHHHRNEYHIPQPPPPPPPPPPPLQEHGWDWQKWEDRRGWDEGRGWDNRRDWDNGRGWDAPRSWDGWQNDPNWDRNYGGPGYYDDQGLRHDGGYGYGPYNGYGYGYESRTAPVAEVPKNAPVVAHRKQTITIYEDPRYDDKEKGKLRREEGDYLELEFKPSSHRYASYDDTSYYNAPSSSREGSMEASKINRLVYNYRGQ